MQLATERGVENKNRGLMYSLIDLSQKDLEIFLLTLVNHK